MIEKHVNQAIAGLKIGKNIGLFVLEIAPIFLVPVAICSLILLVLGLPVWWGISALLILPTMHLAGWALEGGDEE